MVDRLDGVQRLQRTKGVGVIAVTHSVADLEKVGASGFFERSRARIIGPIPRSEVARLSEVMQFSEREKTMLTNWSDSADLGSAATAMTAARIRCKHCSRSLLYLAGTQTPEWVHQDSEARYCDAVDPQQDAHFEAQDTDRIAEPLEAVKQPPSGLGHFLLKLGEGGRPGVPFRAWVTPAEKKSGIHDTDERLDAAAEEQRRAAVTR